ncbi:glycosyl transferase family protein [Candidatus Magnetobacterium bavaricum]|uniref:Glycosyl transferase family protein n=1 Tax=Candidatus Magnetobacterium bavaricum TaxID=29290 RepID=A0A0F3GHA3_9BACT|nr:glycosyl transferase family protein [Candidatus Magnetobacterium bavaricum]
MNTKSLINMDKKNKVSIIMTVRNEEKNITNVIEALLRQTYEYEEIVINDNGSSDRTIEIISEFQKYSPKIRLVKSNGKSIGEGRNTAIEHSCGDILAVMDAGIYPGKDWLDMVVSPMIANNEIDVSWGHVIFDTKSRIRPSSNIDLAIVFLTKYPENKKHTKNVPSSAFRKRVWKKLGGFPEIQLPIEDLILMEEIKNLGFKDIHVFDAKAYYFVYPNSFKDIFKKWIISACCSFLVKKSELGFSRQVLIFSMFFLSLFSILIDIKMVILFFAYIIVFMLSKSRSNKELAKRVFTDFKLFFTVLILFFVLNAARLFGVIKAISILAAGNAPKIVYKPRGFSS